MSHSFVYNDVPHTSTTLPTLPHFTSLSVLLAVKGRRYTRSDSGRLVELLSESKRIVCAPLLTVYSRQYGLHVAFLYASLLSFWSRHLAYIVAVSLMPSVVFFRL